MRGVVVAYLWTRWADWFAAKGMGELSRSCLRHASEGGGRRAADAGFRLGKALLEAGKSNEAVTACERAVLADPGHARAWCALGAAQRNLARMDDARRSYERALALDGDYAQAWSNLGEWWLAKGEPAEALRCLERATELSPDLVEAINNVVAALYELARYTEAEAVARRAIEVHPLQAALHVNLGIVLLHTGRAREGVKAFQKALECDPACAEAHMNLATVLGETQHLAEALEHIEHEIAVKGESAQRLSSLALAQQAKGDLAAAEATCERVLSMQPGNVAALVTLSGCLSARADMAGAIRCIKAALKANPELPNLYSNIAFDSTYLDQVPAAEVFDIHSEWDRRFGHRDGWKIYAHPNAGSADRRLKIGYVSGDFGRHPVGFLMRDVMRHHDRERFEIHCFSMMRGSDEITEAIRAAAAGWHDILLNSDEEVADLVNSEAIDILVDLSGHTAYNRLPAFARRPAPVQASWIGYFHSTGLSAIDYFITDPHTSPADGGQLFSEIPVWLPHSRFCYSPPDYAPEVGAPPAGENGVLTFGSFNRIDKLGEAVVDAWAEILRQVPASRLLLKAGALRSETSREILRQRFASRGIAGERLELRGTSSHPEMLAEYGEVDIALDTWPFNGGMTSLEALWMGVPLVTLRGAGVVSRQTWSLLANIAAPELAFDSVDAYVEGAVTLARDRGAQAALRAGLRERMRASPICQAEAFTRDLEALYRRMWDGWLRGRRLEPYS